MAGQRRPRVFTIPGEVPFVDALAAGLLAEGAGDPLALSTAVVLLPTRRACRSLRDAFLRASGGRTLLLPTIRPIGDVDDDEATITGVAFDRNDAPIPPAISTTRRQLLLARLIHAVRREMAEADDAEHGSFAQAVALAGDLAELLDQMQTERVPLDALRRMVPDHLAGHWQHAIRFLGILADHWPGVLAGEGAVDPAERRNRMLERQAEVWRHHPPAGPVVAAGSTGSILATADLLRVVSRLPRGAVVLPGLDRVLDATAWSDLPESHPQYGLRRLLAFLRVDREDVAEWPGAAHARRDAGGPRGSRANLFAEAMRPAATTDAWRSFPAPGPGALAGVTRLDCPGPEDEARSVALILRSALETPGRTAALVTPDRALARRVAMELRRWQIDIDDSAGRPLLATPVGTFLALLARTVAEGFAPVSLLAALKHPLASGGMRTDRFRRRVRELERRVLRGPRPGPGTAGILAALSDSDADTELRGWLLLLEQTVAPLVEALASERLLLVDAIRAHVAAAEALAADEDGDGAQRLWTGDDGEVAAAAIDDLLAAAADIPAIPGAEYPDLFAALCAGRVVRPRYGRHPRLAIWGLLEARLQRADVMILGGLNEGTWPPDPDADPWLSHGMRRTLGLPTPERRIGLTAHDFVQAASGGNVVLTRAEKVDGTPTVPSRWLLRIDAVLGAAREVLHPTSPWLDWQEALDRTSAAPRPVAPPAPRPPVEARPRRLSVTAVETWIRDPYSIYARRILGLAPLDPIDADPGAADRGVFIHDSLDRFLREVGTELPPDSLDRLHEIGRNLLGDALARPGVWAFWWPRFERIAAWFVDAVGRRLAEGSVVSFATETRGSIELQGPAGSFTLVAKADRIDTLGEGALEIVDYKTGAMPSRRLVDLGVAPQLALEAAIARRGGFEGVAAAPVAALTYWRLVGNTTGGEIRAAGSHAAATLADDAERGLARLIAVFDDPATAYRSRPRPRYAPRFSDYDHLARVAEWSADFDDGDA